jgi:hypothetical protein
MRPLLALAAVLVAGSLSSGALAAGATMYTPPLSSRGDDLHCSILNVSSNTASATVTGFSNGAPSTDTLTLKPGKTGSLSALCGPACLAYCRFVTNFPASSFRVSACISQVGTDNPSVCAEGH